MQTEDLILISVDDHVVERHTSQGGGGNARIQFGLHFRHEIVIDGLGVHRLRPAAHVHDHQCRPGVGDDARQLGFVP